MKRYVRLTNSIEEIVKESHCYYSPQPKCWHLKDHYLIKEDDKDFKKYRFSDSIEELCDCFVLYDITAVFPHEEYEIYRDFKEAKENYETWREREDCVDLYGAIWTNEGLSYVAKLNDKGDFELL